MPRANRRRRDDRPLGGQFTGAGVREEFYDGRLWSVRTVTGQAASSSGRPWLCPGCSQDIQPGTPHVVVWPAEGVGGLGDRRHWHSGCWSARGRRHPTGATR